MAQAADEEKVGGGGDPNGPSVLILGGCGFIGRHMVQFLVSKKVCSKIIVADKQMPMVAYMSQILLNTVWKNPVVTFIQVDLAKKEHVEKKKVLETEMDYIINLCGETKFGQTDNDYKVRNLDTAVLIADMIKKAKWGDVFKKWIEVSTAQIYDPVKEPGAKETHRIAPWTKLATWRYEVEKRLSLFQLPVVTLRPSIVYGPADKTGITPRLVCAACYKSTGEQMTFLWTKGVRCNTVHVRDLCSAIWTSCIEAKPGKIYNISDAGDTTQGSMNSLLEDVFKIKCSFQNAAMNSMAKKMMTYAAQMSNDKHMPMWSNICKQQKLDSPLSPYLDEEILNKNHLGVDGRLITKETNFRYKYPKMKPEYLVEVMDEYAQQRYFPDIRKM